MALANQRKRFGRLTQRLVKDDGMQLVPCRICRDRLRVISGRHLSKHGTDRETYMEEYRLTPDELIAKDFRVIQSSRRGYFPHGKRNWIAAIKQVYTRDRDITQKYLRREHPHLYDQGVWIFGDWDKALRAAGFDPELTRIRSSADEERIVNEIRAMRRAHLPLNAHYCIEAPPETVLSGHATLRILEQRACRRRHYNETVS